MAKLLRKTADGLDAFVNDFRIMEIVADPPLPEGFVDELEKIAMRAQEVYRSRADIFSRDAVAMLETVDAHPKWMSSNIAFFRGAWNHDRWGCRLVIAVDGVDAIQDKVMRPLQEFANNLALASPESGTSSSDGETVVSP
ncbi:hypothetical protein HOI83_04285 [Candidatus Uhrbacteria bacterium]|nr:hypothetical protein [Candidatus Uhrbacteria bacterium]